MISMPKECHHYTSRHFGVIWELTDILRVLKRLCWHNLFSPFWFAVQWDTCSVQVCRYRLLEDEFSNPSVPDIQKYLTDEDYRWLVYRSAFRCWFIYFLQHSLRLRCPVIPYDSAWSFLVLMHCLKHPNSFWMIGFFYE